MMAKHTKTHGHYMGHDREPPQPHGPKPRGKKPLVHSHSARPKTNILPKHGSKKMF